MALRTIVAALLLPVLPASAHADIEALLGKYATSGDGCASTAAPEFEIRRGIVEGPDLLCILGAPKEASAGREAYEAKCTQGDKVHLGVLTFDLSAKPDHIKIGLPENQDWIALYRCK
jgi:hypothetical protein